jgi:hypothetical protein
MIQFIKNENCDATELDGEWIILNTEQYTITKINDVGGHCWLLLNERQTADSLTQSVLENFSSNEHREHIQKDIEEFLSNLGRLGLIQSVD